MESSPSSFSLRWGWWGLYALTCLALYLRLEIYLDGHWPFYVHDRSRHEEYVRYVHETGLMPPADAGLEAHQQPLYYFVVAPFYHTDIDWGLRLAYLAGIGLLLSMLGLLILISSLKYIGSWMVRYVLFIYIGFTPSFIFASPFIGNDGMVILMGIYLFFCMVRFNRNPLSGACFRLCVLAAVASLFSKINALSLMPALLWLLWRTYQIAPARWTLLAQRATLIGLALILWTIVTEYHAHLGRGSGTNVVAILNIQDLAPMKIPDTGLSYVTTFHVGALITAGQATTLNTTPDSVRFSYLTFQYGTMLLGEYIYSHPSSRLWASRWLLVSGLLLVGGVCLYVSQVFIKIRSCYRNSVPLTTLFILLLSNLAVLYFVTTTPYTCDADFRYQYPALAWIGYAMGRGLAAFPRVKAMKYAVALGLGLYLIACLNLFIVAGMYRPSE